ncbi:MAG: hypothetical protein R3F11_21740 [Verrucomicrobiales bacterium]
MAGLSGGQGQEPERDPHSAPTCPAPAVPAEGEPAEEAAAEATDRSPTEVEAEVLSIQEVEAELGAISMPTPGEYFAALRHHVSPRWRRHYRGSISEPQTDRQKVALELGGMFADGFLILEAKDGQGIANIARDLRSHATILGAGERFGPVCGDAFQSGRGRALEVVRRDLERSQLVLAEFLRAQRDEKLVALIQVGLWLRTFQIGTEVLAENQEEGSEHPKPTLCVGSPALLERLAMLMEKIPAVEGEAECVKDVRADVENLANMWLGEAGPRRTESKVERTQDRIQRLLREISEKR